MTAEPAKAATSARGLFSATGKKAKPVKVRNEITGEITIAAGRERHPDDFDPTPAEPTRAFLAAEHDRLIDFGMLWEPAAGDGAMVREIEAAGFPCYKSDLIDRGCGAEIRDYFSYAREECPAKAQVTNPPYNRVNWRDGRGEWIKHGMGTLGLDYMALLLSWNWPGAGGLSKVWAEFPPARVYLMRWKIDFTGDGSPPMLNAWFVWDRAYQGEPILRMLDRGGDLRQAEMF